MTKLSPQFSHFCARLWRTSRLRLSKVAVNFSWHQHIRPRLNNHNFGNTWFSSLKVFSVLVQKVQNSSDLCHSQFWILAAFSIFADLPADSHLLENVYFSREKYGMKYTYKQIAAHVSFLGCLMPLSYTYSSSIVLCLFVQRAYYPYIWFICLTFLTQSTSLTTFFKRFCKKLFSFWLFLFVKSGFVFGWLNLKWSFSTPLGCREKLNPFGKDSKPRFPKIFVNKFTRYL